MVHLAVNVHQGIFRARFIFLQNIMITLIITTIVTQWSWTMVTFIWISYLLGGFLKLTFYFMFHPWSELIRADLMKTLKSLSSSDEEVEWSICFGTNWLKCKMNCGCCRRRKTRSASINGLDTIEDGETYMLSDI